MFPLEFDHKMLESLPFPEEEGIKRVTQILKAIIMRRVMPYFRNRRGTEATFISRLSEHLIIQRLEDPNNLVRTVSLVSQKNNQWIIHIHERVFDYLAFVIPSDPESRLGGKSSEEGKMLAFAEFMLRHEIEHMLYPQRSERDAINSDVEFAMEKRSTDPTFYRMLRNALADEMVGLKGNPYLAALDSAEREQAYETLITRILATHVVNLSNIPEVILEGIFPILDTDMKVKVLGECYRRSRDTSYSLTRRTSSLEKVMRFFKRLSFPCSCKEPERSYRRGQGQFVISTAGLRCH